MFDYDDDDVDDDGFDDTNYQALSVSHLVNRVVDAYLASPRGQVPRADLLHKKAGPSMKTFKATPAPLKFKGGVPLATMSRAEATALLGSGLVAAYVDRPESLSSSEVSLYDYAVSKLINDEACAVEPTSVLLSALEKQSRAFSEHRMEELTA